MINDERLDFENVYTVQVYKDIYAFRYLTKDDSLVIKYAITASDDILITERTTFNPPKASPSLVTFRNQYIMVTGGINQKKFDVYKSVEWYDIKTNQWSNVAPLNTPRSNHSSCVLKDIIYVFCGYNGTSGWLNTIEKIDAGEYADKKWGTQWEFLKVQS